MDVHAPHESVHSWKDFAIHLTVVTIGLFIALMLEAGVEYWHHRHVVAEARRNIREELRTNHEAALDDIQRLDQNIEIVKGNVKAIHVLSTHPKDFHGSITNSMSFNSLNDAAWRTARDTGALSYMPYEEVQRYSDIYMLEEVVNQKSINTGEQSFRAAAPIYMGYDVDQLPATEYTQMLRDNATTLIELVTLKQIVQQSDQLTVKELNR